MPYKKFIPLITLIFVFFGSLAVFALTAKAQTESGYKISVSIPNSSQAQAGKTTSLDDYVKSIYRFALALTAIAALVSLIIGGIVYITSETISSKENAKEYIWNAVIGLLLAVSAYLILYTINPDLVSFKEPPLPTPSPGTTGGTTGGGETTQGLTEEQARAQLAEAHIGVKPECSQGQTIDCVRLAGIQQATLNEILKLKQECPDCAIFITGGTEPGHESTAHENGYKVDLRLDDTLNNYIMGADGQGANGFIYSGERTGQYAGPRYQRGGATYVKETNDPHWDVLVTS